MQFPFFLYKKKETKQLDLQEEGIKVIEGIGKMAASLMLVGYSTPEILQKECILKQIFQVKSKELIVLCGAPGIWIAKKPLLTVDQAGNQVGVFAIVMTIGLINNDKMENESLVYLLRLVSSVVWISKGIMVEELSLFLGKLINGGQQEDSSTGLLWVDTYEGQPLEAKERLEKALALINGFSDQIEERNRVRRAINAIFKERDCLSAAESSLQMPGIAQTIKKRICSRMRKIDINGEVLGGVLRAGISRNSNLEKVLGSVRKAEGERVGRQALEAYEVKLQEIEEHKIPCLVEELNAFHKIAKENALIVVKKAKITNSLEEEILKDVQKKIKARFQITKQENDKESYRRCISFIQQEFATILNKQRNSEYRSFAEFERDIHLFYKYFMDNGPKTANKQIILMEYLQKAIFEGSTFFLKKMVDQLQEINEQNEEISSKFEAELMEANQKAEDQKNSFQIRINELETEKYDIEQQLLQMDNLKNSFQTQTTRQESELKKIIEKLQFENQNLQQQMINDKFNQEVSIKEIERKNQIIEADFIKEKELLVKRNEYYEKQINEYQRNEQISQNEKTNKEKQNTEYLKELTVKFEQKVKQFQMELQKAKEKLLEYENELQIKDQQFEMEKKKLNLNESFLSNQLKQTKEQIEKLKNENFNLLQKNSEINEINNKNLNNKFLSNEQKQQQSEKIQNEYQTTISKLEKTVHEKEEIIKMFKSNSEKDKAIMIQKLEFSEVQVKDLKKKLDDSKEAYEKMVKAFEQTNLQQCQELNQKQDQEIKAKHKNQIKALELELANNTYNLQKQLKEKEEQNNELQLELRLVKKNLESEIENNRNELQMREQLLTKLKENNRLIELDKAKLINENELRNIKKIENLEYQLEETKRQYQQELEQQQASAEEQLYSLKKVFSEEKSVLIQGYEKSKSQYESKINRNNDEYDIKLQEQQNQYEEEIDLLREEIKDLECEKNQIFNESNADRELKKEKIMMLEKEIDELKNEKKCLEEKCLGEQTVKEQKRQDERVKMMEQIERITKEKQQIEKQLQSAMEKEKWRTNEINELESKIEEIQVSYKQNEETLRKQLKVGSLKCEQFQQELMEVKMQLEKENALNGQERGFSEQRITEISQENERLRAGYEEKMNCERENWRKEKEQLNEVMQQEIEKLQQKLQKNKARTQELMNEKCRFENERLQEKANDEKRRNNQEKELTEIKSQLQSEVSANIKLREQLQVEQMEKKRLIEIEMKEQKKMTKEFEEEKERQINELEKEKMLLEGRCNFAEDQRNEAKEIAKDLQTRVEILTAVIENMEERKKLGERQQNEEEIQERVEQAIDKVQNELNYQMQTLENKLVSKAKELEKEKKQFREKYERVEREKLALEDKVVRLTEESRDCERKRDESRGRKREQWKAKEKRMNQEWEQEKERLLGNISNQEEELRVIEGKKTQLMFELEKEKTKIRIINEDAQEKVAEWQNKYQESERKREMLTRENERLKGMSALGKKQMGNSQKQLTLQNSSNSSSYSQIPLSSNFNQVQGGLNDITNKQNWQNYHKMNEIDSSKQQQPCCKEEEEENKQQFNSIINL